MINKTKKIDLVEVEWATYRLKDWEKHILKQAEIIQNDPERKERLEAQLCKRCSIGGRIAGQACTYWNCGICDKQDLYGNTDTPVLCKECAKRNDLCMHCGAQIDGKQKRKLK